MENESHINPVIFRSLDIRGKVGTEITETAAEIIGKAFGTFVRENNGQTVFTGHDNRPSSPSLVQAFTCGLISTGCEATELGMVPTPLVYYASAKNPGTYGAMVTASHLPASNNGFKFCKGSLSLHKEINGRIKQIALTGKFILSSGRHSNAQAWIEEYEKEVSQIILGDKKIKIILDCQNGAASIVAPHIMQSLGINFESIHTDIHSLYPYERPDPQIPSTLKGLIGQVLAVGADLGIAYDGDADRIGIVDDSGNQVAIDRLLAIIAADILKRDAGRKIVYDALCSQVFVDAITQHGGIAIASKSGHAYVKEVLIQEKGIMGGELSGHIFFADRYLGFDDGIYASLRLIELLSNSPLTLSEMLDSLPKLYSLPEERPHCPDEKKKIIIEDLEQVFRSEDYHIETADGIRIQFPHGWGIIRASGTEPALSLRVEADNQQALDQYHDILWNKLLETCRKNEVNIK